MERGPHRKHMALAHASAQLEGIRARVDLKWRACPNSHIKSIQILRLILGLRFEFGALLYIKVGIGTIPPSGRRTCSSATTVSSALPPQVGRGVPWSVSSRTCQRLSIPGICVDEVRDHPPHSSLPVEPAVAFHGSTHVRFVCCVRASEFFCHEETESCPSSLPLGATADGDSSGFPPCPPRSRDAFDRDLGATKQDIGG